MLEFVIGVILLITYLAFIVYAAKGGNLMLGLFVMAVLWSGLGFLGGGVAALFRGACVHIIPFLSAVWRVRRGVWCVGVWVVCSPLAMSGMVILAYTPQKVNTNFLHT